MICFDFNTDCTGCRACGDICPKGCITFSEDSDGFVMPSLSKDSCINCGLCEKVCPALNYQVEAYEERKCFAVYHNNEDIRVEGSSGSVFYSLAEKVIQNQGTVYGASFDKNLQLHHTRTADMDGVRTQMKSKYIQSDTTGIYKQVLADLRGGKEVLFVGTPCQCQALHNMTPAKLREQLLIADIICHGVPSQNLFNQNIKQFEKTNDCKVSAFSFREKTSLSLRNYKITYIKDGNDVHEQTGELDDIPFCIAYFNHWSLRNSCYACKQRGVKRIADITLGDFWGLKKIFPDINDFEKGYSSVIVNTAKGQKTIEQLSTCVVKEIPDGVQFIIQNNHAYTKPDKKSLMRKVFFWCLRNYGYEFCGRHLLSTQPSFLGRLVISTIIRIDRM